MNFISAQTASNTRKMNNQETTENNTKKTT